MKEVCNLLIDKIEKLEKELTEKEEMLDNLSKYLTHHDINILVEPETIYSRLDEEEE